MVSVDGCGQIESLYLKTGSFGKLLIVYVFKVSGKKQSRNSLIG